MQKPVTSRKSVSKLLGIGTFLLFFILKGAFPKPAFAFVSSLDACAAQPECAAAISSEVAPAVATPTAEGVASTITATTATGATTTTQAAAGVAVVGDMRLSGIAAYYLWSRGVNGQAQEIAKQRYCAAYPNDSVCPKRTVTFYSPNNRGTIKYYIPETIVSYWIEDCIVNKYNYGPSFNGTRQDGSRLSYVCGPGIDPSTLKDERTEGIPWKDWPQQKRSIAVAALTNSDWLGLITSMPVGGRLNPGDTANAPSGIVIPGEETDDPITPQDDRLPRKERGFFTNPGSPNTDFDKDGTPDTSDPEPQNPNVPRASSEPSNLPEESGESGEDSGSQPTEDEMWADLDEFNNPSIGAPTTPEGRTLSNHAQESLPRHGFEEPYSKVDEIIDNASRQTPQEDAATVYI